MSDKCDFRKMEMCSKAIDSGIIIFNQSMITGFTASIVGSGLNIDYCPYCGVRLTDIEIVMISGNPYGKSPIVEAIKRGFLNAPIIPISSEEDEVENFRRDSFKEIILYDYRHSLSMAKFQKHIEELNKKKCPSYVNDSLDALIYSIKGSTCMGVDFGAGEDFSPEVGK